MYHVSIIIVAVATHSFSMKWGTKSATVAIFFRHCHHQDALQMVIALKERNIAHKDIVSQWELVRPTVIASTPQTPIRCRHVLDLYIVMKIVVKSIVWNLVIHVSFRLVRKVSALKNMKLA